VAAGEEARLAGRYRVVRRLGAGGMGTVHLAEDERLGRPVAIKRLHAESAREIARRFQREAKLGASLNHPNLVAVYDAVSDEEDVLIVMEYVDGPTLAQRLRQGRIHPAEALAALEGVAAALDHAHAHGVVHRDVKPGNVLLGPGGAAKLADLGIASAVEGTQITRSGAVLGTPAYMAPEQLEGGRTGPASDVYALAAVAYETLSGCRARLGRTPMEIAHRAATEPPPDLRAAWPEAPAAASETIRRAMARDRAERPESAGALLAELREALFPAAATARTAELPAGPVGAAPVPPAAGPSGATASPPPTTDRPPPDRGRSGVSPGQAGEAAAPGRREPLRSRRRAAPLAALAATAALALAAVLLAGGSEQPAPAPDRPPSARTGPPPAAAQRAAADTVREFYELSADDRYEEAWALAGEGFRALFQGSFDSYVGTVDTLEEFEFLSLEPTRQSADSVSLAARSVARHTNGVDRCRSTYEVARGEDGRWRIEDGSISCPRSTRPASGE
jgi:serine/threonine-protein kinase